MKLTYADMFDLLAADELARRYFENLPQREVAARLGISRSYVSRIEKCALDKLRAKLS